MNHAELTNLYYSDYNRKRRGWHFVIVLVCSYTCIRCNYQNAVLLKFIYMPFFLLFHYTSSLLGCYCWSFLVLEIVGNTGSIGLLCLWSFPNVWFMFGMKVFMLIDSSRAHPSGTVDFIMLTWNVNWLDKFIFYHTLLWILTLVSIVGHKVLHLLVKLRFSASLSSTSTQISLDWWLDPSKRKKERIAYPSCTI